MDQAVAENCVIILGTRGSLPVSGIEYTQYGGATTCVLVRLGGRSVILDAGTGLMGLPEAEILSDEPLPLMITHPHIDHLLGLPLCLRCLRAGSPMDIYMADRAGMDAKTTIERLFTPPYWPVGLTQLPADIRFHPLAERVALDGVLVETMEGEHPGGVTLLRLTGGDKHIVFATDCTLTDALLPELERFARDCDLLLIDGQYSDAEWPGRKNFGHSRWTDAARLGRACGARKVRVIHHDPAHTDAALDAAAEELRRICPQADFGREGEEIAL